MRQVPADVAQVVVERPDRDVGLAGLEQLAHRRLGAGVGAQDPGVRGEAAGLTEVGQHRLLVLPLLRATVQLRHRDDRDLELLGQQLERTGELRDLLLAALDALARRHQLQVVDDDELEVVALLEPPRLGPDLHHRHVRGVVDVERRVGDLAHPAGELRPVLVGQRAGAHVVQRHLRLGRQQTHRDLVLAHLQREDRRRQVVLHRRRARDVQSERRVVRRDEAAPGEEQVVLGVDLDAAHRHAGDRPHVGDEPDAAGGERARARAPCAASCLRSEPEDLVVGAEGERVAGRRRLRPTGHALAAHPHPVAEAGDQLPRRPRPAAGW